MRLKLSIFCGSIMLFMNSCIVDCDGRMDDTKIVFTNNTDSTVAIFLPNDDYAIFLLEPRTTRNAWVYFEPDAYRIQVGNLSVIDSLNPLVPDTVNIFKGKIKKGYTIGKRKCKKDMTDIQYFINQQTIDEAK